MLSTRNEIVCPLVNRTATPALLPGAHTALFTPGGSVSACPVSVNVPVSLIFNRLTTLDMADVTSTEPSSHTSTELLSVVAGNVPTTARVATLITARGATADPSLTTRNFPSRASDRSSTNGMPAG